MIVYKTNILGTNYPVIVFSHEGHTLSVCDGSDSVTYNWANDAGIDPTLFNGSDTLYGGRGLGSQSNDFAGTDNYNFSSITVDGITVDDIYTEPTAYQEDLETITDVIITGSAIGAVRAYCTIKEHVDFTDGEHTVVTQLVSFPVITVSPSFSVTSTDPADAATNVPVRKNPITITFSEAPKSSTITSDNLIIRHDTSRIIYPWTLENIVDAVVTLHNTWPFPAGTVMEGTVVSGASGVLSNADDTELASDYVWHFTTESPDPPDIIPGRGGYTWFPTEVDKRKVSPNIGVFMFKGLKKGGYIK